MTTHASSVKTYLVIYVILLVLLAATVGVNELQLGPFALAAALAIAIVKTVLIVLYFMHVRESDSLTKFVVVTGVVWLIFLIGITMSEIVTRPSMPPGSSSLANPMAAEASKGPARS